MSADLDPRPEDADVEALLAAADQQRDAAAWNEAAALYGKVVELRPEAWPLMVQQGHCLKEAGFLTAALERYHDAERLAPEDADIQLQLGHAYKLLAMRKEAAGHYARALALAPGNPDAQREAAAAAGWGDEPAPPPPASPEGEAPSLLLDMAPEFPPAPPPFLASAPALAEAPPPAAGFSLPAAPAPAPLQTLATAPAPAIAAPQPPPPAAAPAPAPQPAAPQPAAPGQAAVLRLFLDVSDLLIYFAGARTPTGIQRVQMGIVSRAAAAPAPAGMAIALARYDADALCWRPVDKAAFTALCALASSGADAEAADWVTARDALYARTTSSAPIAFPEGAILVNLGNSWGLPDYFRALTAMRQRHGLRYLPFVHDCVPLIVPEHCQQSTVHDYARWFAAMALQADGLLCNSENTRRDVLQQLGRLMPGFSLPAHVVRLDADPRELVPETLGASGALRALRPGESFALFVATLESRKNHLLVFSAWLELLRRHGPARVPRLVCVGRAGWHAEPALSLLRSVPELQRHVLLLSGVSDQDLATLYAGCAFTLYNSHYEGWGLPVTEALAHGKVVITPRHSSLTEAGGEAALYFTPQSQPELVALVERVAFEPDFRAAQEAVARQKGQPRSWAAVKDNVLEAVAALARHPMRPAEGRMPLRLGQPYATQRACLPRPDITLAVAEAACQGPGWHRQEEWGLWCREGHATLRLPLPDEARGVPLRLYLDLRQPGEALVVGLRASLLQTNLLHASLGGAPLTQVELPLEGSGDVTFVVDLPAAHGTQPGVELELDLDNGPGVAAEGIAGLARTQIGAGLRGFMICRTDDHAARLAFLERKSFLSPGQ